MSGAAPGGDARPGPGRWRRVRGPLRRRITDVSLRGTGRQRAIGVGVYFGGGTVAGLLVLLLSDDRTVSTVGLAVVTGLAALVAGVFLALGRRMPPGAYHVVPFAGTLGITGTMIAGNGGLVTLLAPMLLVFVVDFGALFLSTSMLALQAAFAVAADAVAMVVSGRGAEAPAQVALTATVLVTSGSGVRYLTALVARMGLQDRLTGLPSRLGIRRTVDVMVGSARRGHHVAMLLLDLDGFREINDTLGHSAGDALLVELANRLRAVAGPKDLVCRLGGDEFLVVVPGLRGPVDAERTALRVLEELQLPLAVKGILLDPDFSVGVALAPADGASFEELLQHADVAMYRAKAEQGRIARYDARHDPHDPARLALLGDLRAALPAPGEEPDASGGLELHYQPKAGLPHGDVRGVEALLRWNHPTRGPLPPDDFVPFAERTGLVGPLTRWVLETACRQLGEWRRAGHGLSVAINVPARVLLEPRFPDDVVSACARHGVSPRALVVEITERTLVGDHGRAQHALAELAGLGVRLSLDDFGTGYSSMAYLGRLPLHELKIDRCFVAGLDRVASDSAIVTAAIDIGRSLGLEVVAEGVEDAATHASITRLGCTTVQGFFVAPPLPAPELTRWLDALPVVLADERPSDRVPAPRVAVELP